MCKGSGQENGHAESQSPCGARGGARRRRQEAQVRVDAVEYCTPNPDRWGFHKSGLDLEHMRVLVQTRVRAPHGFRNAQRVTQWFGHVNHRYDLQRNGFVIDCPKCAGPEVGPRLRIRPPRNRPRWGLHARTDVCFFSYAPGPIVVRSPANSVRLREGAPWNVPVAHIRRSAFLAERPVPAQLALPPPLCIRLFALPTMEPTKTSSIRRTSITQARVSPYGLSADSASGTWCEHVMAASQL